MKTGRKPYVEPRVQWKLYLPATIAGQIELLLLDPVRDRPKYGARNELVEKLLKDWMQSQKALARSAPADGPSLEERLIAAIEFEVANFGMHSGDWIRRLISNYRKEKEK